MNCPQCQAENGPGAAFCGNCGARLAPAEAAAAPSGGYQAPQAGTPLGYGAAPGAAPGVPEPPGGYGPAGGYNAPGGYNQAVPQPPAGYQQGQYQPPAGSPYAPRRAGGASPVAFDINRLTTVDRIVAVATLGTFIALWLPWYSVSVLGASYSFDAFSWGHGWMWIEFIVALALLAYLVMRAAWDTPPFKLPVAHAPLLIVGTGLQFLLIVIGFADIPYGSQGMGLTFGAFFGLICAIVAAAPVVYPAVRSYLDSRR